MGMKITLLCYIVLYAIYFNILGILLGIPFKSNTLTPYLRIWGRERIWCEKWWHVWWHSLIVWSLFRWTWQRVELCWFLDGGYGVLHDHVWWRRCCLQVQMLGLWEAGLERLYHVQIYESCLWTQPDSKKLQTIGRIQSITCTQRIGKIV